MVGPIEQRMTLEQFLDWDDGTDRRYELVDGVVLAMAPPSVAHGVVVGNLVGLLRSGVRSGCAVVAEGGVVVPGRKDAFYQADVVVTCRPQHAKARYVEEPSLIIEVLSPSTAGHDRNMKLDDYRSIASVNEILFVSTLQRRVQLWVRAGDHWRVQDFIGDSTFQLAAISAAISVADLYENVHIAE
jgi:Uma2 family endonuclease